MEIKLTASEAVTLGTLFNEAALFAASDSNRIVLSGVRFENEAGHLRMVATDSFVLGIFDLSDNTLQMDEGWSTLIDAGELVVIGKALVKQFKSVYPTDVPKVTLTFGAHELVAECDAWTMKAHVIDADFPNYRALLPTGDGFADAWPALNTTYLAMFGKLLLGRPAPKKGKRTDFGLRFECYGSLKPVKFTGHSQFCDFYGLLMPVRTA